MKAVVWTDLFQGVVMLVGILTVLIMVSAYENNSHNSYRLNTNFLKRLYVSQGASEVGGLPRIWEISEAGGRLDLFKY